MNTAGPIKEFAVGIYDGPHATPEPSDDGPIFLGIKNVTEDGRLDFSETRHVSEKEFPKWTRRVKPQRDDIVFSYEATLHRYARIPDGFEGCLGRRMALIRPDVKKVDPRFLHYYLLSPIWRAKMDAITINGATVNRIPLTSFPDTVVSFPGLNEQSAIADILSAYDDLIENNQRRIALLEEAARMLYREWFVHFRFPGHEHVKIIDGLPDGWTIGPIRESYLGLFDGPHATPAPSDEGPVFLGIKNIRETGGLDLSNIRHVSAAEFLRWTRRVTPMEGDIVFSYEATLHLYALVPRGLQCCLGRRMALIRPKEEYRLFLYLNFFSERWRRDISARIINGATVDRISLKAFPDFPTLLPEKRIAAAFCDEVAPYFNLIDTLAEINQKLAQARDLLLPRLMNGEIAV